MLHSLILVDNLSTSACGGHDFNFGFDALNATGLAIEALIGSTITLHMQGSRSISLKVLQCPAPRLVLPWFPRKSKSEIDGRTFAQQCADDSLVHGAL